MHPAWFPMGNPWLPTGPWTPVQACCAHPGGPASAQQAQPSAPCKSEAARAPSPASIALGMALAAHAHAGNTTAQPGAGGGSPAFTHLWTALHSMVVQDHEALPRLLDSYCQPSETLGASFGICMIARSHMSPQ